MDITCLQIHFMDASSQSTTPKLVQAREAGLEYYVEHWRDKLLVLTNANGHTNNCLMVADLANPQRRQAIP